MLSKLKFSKIFDKIMKILFYFEKADTKTLKHLKVSIKFCK